MIPNLLNGTSSTQFKDSDILAGHQAIVFMSTVDLSTKFQTFPFLKFAKLIHKSYLLETKTFYKKLSLQRNLVKTVTKIRKKVLKRIHRTSTTWIEFSSSPIKLILLPLKLKMLK
jgi:hypothetical protein